MSVKVAVVGCGYWGPNLIRNFSQLDETEVAYICDLDPKRMAHLKSTYPIVKTTTEYKQILDDPEVDAIVIAVPVAHHYLIAKEALLKGKHVLIEKPMTASVKEAEELIEIAKKQKKILMVDHTFEYSEPISKMREIVESGELGDIYYIRADWLNLGLLQPDVNVIWDLATHIASIINFVTGLKPVSLTATGGAYVRKHIPEVAHMKVEYPRNVAAYLTVSWLEPKKTRSITIVGTKKMLVYDLTNEEEQIKIFDKGVDITTDINDIRQFRINYRYGDIYVPNIKKVEPLQNMCSHFADCIANDKQPISNGEVGLEVVKILESAEASLKKNGAEILIEK